VHHLKKRRSHVLVSFGVRRMSQGKCDTCGIGEEWR
jgi:hypothetical protein